MALNSPDSTLSHTPVESPTVPLRASARGTLPLDMEASMIAMAEEMEGEPILRPTGSLQAVAEGNGGPKRIIRENSPGSRTMQIMITDPTRGPLGMQFVRSLNAFANNELEIESPDLKGKLRRLITDPEDIHTLASDGKDPLPGKPETFFEALNRFYGLQTLALDLNAQLRVLDQENTPEVELVVGVAGIDPVPQDPSLRGLIVRRLYNIAKTSSELAPKLRTSALKISGLDY